jgi:hypothetical protein
MATAHSLQLIQILEDAWCSHLHTTRLRIGYGRGQKGAM